MRRRLKHWCAITVLLAFYVVRTVEAGQETDYPGQSGVEGLEALLVNYAISFPDIHFSLLSGDSSVEYLNSLPAMLGADASNSDYEHPLQVRELLLQAQFDRIRLMQRENLPSSTLFKTGLNAAFNRPYVCVLTLNELAFSRDPMAATRFIAGENAMVTSA